MEMPRPWSSDAPRKNKGSYSFTLLEELACASLSMFCMRLLDTGSACISLPVPKCVVTHTRKLPRGPTRVGEQSLLSRTVLCTITVYTLQNLLLTLLPS